MCSFIGIWKVNKFSKDREKFCLQILGFSFRSIKNSTILRVRSYDELFLVFYDCEFLKIFSMRNLYERKRMSFFLFVIVEF